LTQQNLDSFAGESDGSASEIEKSATDAPDTFGPPVPDDDTSQTEDDTRAGLVATAAGEDTAVEIVVDQRELDSSIARDLSTRENCETRLETLAVGDYVLSDRVVVERKSVSDFLDTLTGGDRSLFDQVGDDARHYARPVVVIEGTDLYGERNVHPNAIRGALAS